MHSTLFVHRNVLFTVLFACKSKGKRKLESRKKNDDDDDVDKDRRSENKEITRT